MNTPGIQFDLLRESRAACGASGAPLLPLPVPSDPQFLLVDPSGVPRFSLVADGSNDDIVLLESAPRGPFPFPSLVLLSIGDTRVRVNGDRAPVVAVLRERDCVQIGDEVFHVALRVSPSIIPVGGSPLEGQECPICSTRFKPMQLAYVCPFCDTPMHAGGEGGLDCMNHTSDCRGCRRDVIRRETVTSFPALVAHAHSS
jgi:hypothetical protein